MPLADAVLGPYIHHIDPVIADVGPVHIWWYGLGYAAGFLELFMVARRHRAALALTLSNVYVLTLMVAAGVLAGGRAVEVAFDEWPFYRQHASLVPALWLGGMATHGLLLGAAAGAWVFAAAYGKPFLALADLLVIPGAFLMGIGRLGNFIDGQIVGRITDLPWGVQFPYAAGFRHPVVLYDGLKNLLLMPYLMRVRRTNPTPGATAARFVFWYAFPRIFIDLFRDYPTHRLALGTGQTLNLVMAALGVILLVRSRRRRQSRAHVPGRPTVPVSTTDTVPVALRLAFVALLLACLTIPSNWTQDVPDHYGLRHHGMEHSSLYPRINTAPPTR